MGRKFLSDIEAKTQMMEGSILQSCVFVKTFVFHIIILWRKKEFVEYAVPDVG
ncbi:hypothetical protein ACFLQS_01965 [Actinomycetota bacterium]